LRRYQGVLQRLEQGVLEELQELLLLVGELGLDDLVEVLVGLLVVPDADEAVGLHDGLDLDLLPVLLGDPGDDRGDPLLLVLGLHLLRGHGLREHDAPGLLLPLVKGRDEVVAEVLDGLPDLHPEAGLLRLLLVVLHLLGLFLGLGPDLLGDVVDLGPLLSGLRSPVLGGRLCHSPSAPFVSF